MTRTLQIKGVGGETGDRSEALRLKGPPVETIKLDAEIDATDQLELADGQATQEVGLHPQLAALEMIVYPTSDQLSSNNQLAQVGTLEIVPMEAPLSFFHLEQEPDLAGAPDRIQHHRGGLRRESESDSRQGEPGHARPQRGRSGFDHKGGNLFMTYLRTKEQLAAQSPNGTLAHWASEAFHDRSNQALQALLQRDGRSQSLSADQPLYGLETATLETPTAQPLSTCDDAFCRSRIASRFFRNM